MPVRVSMFSWCDVNWTKVMHGVQWDEIMLLDVVHIPSWPPNHESGLNLWWSCDGLQVHWPGWCRGGNLFTPLLLEMLCASPQHKSTSCCGGWVTWLRNHCSYWAQLPPCPERPWPRQRWTTMNKAHSSKTAWMLPLPSVEWLKEGGGKGVSGHDWWHELMIKAKRERTTVGPNDKWVVSHQWMMMTKSHRSWTPMKHEVETWVHEQNRERKILTNVKGVP